MADITQHNYTGNYSGLLNNFYITLIVAGVCVVGYEIEVHIPRRRGRDGTFRRIPVRVYCAAKEAWGGRKRGRRKGDAGRARPISQEGLMREGEKGYGRGGEGEGAAESLDGEEAERKRLGDRESWEFGYIYQPKAWRFRWPLAWVWSALKVRERDMPETCGLDITLHMRFLRGCFFYTFLQACTVLPILMPLHIFYSPDNISSTSMIRASVSSLVVSSGSRWLWVHAVLIWWVTITWTATVLWITWGALAYRRREIKRLAKRVEASRETKRRLALGEDGLGRGGADDADKWTVGDERDGIKRFRTLMVTNVPPDMRDEKVLQDYFDHYIHRHQVRCGQIAPKKAVPNITTDKDDTLFQRVALSPRRLLKKPTALKSHPAVPTTPPGETSDSLDLPRTTGGAEDDECDGQMWETEVHEVILVRKLGSVLSLRNRRSAVLRQLELAHVKLAQRVLKAVSKYKAKHADVCRTRVVIHPVHDMEKGIDGLNALRNESLPEEITKEERMERLVAALGRFVDDEPEQLGRRGEETVWDVLHSLPRELLDPYQSLTHMTSVFRDENAPLIDFLTTKLSYLTLLLDEARSKPLSSYAASSTAFVTFRDAKTARLAHKILDSHPKRSLACHTMPAPDWTDLLWARMGKSVYRSEFVRGWVVYLGVWAFTLVWIFPVSLLCALSSLNNIAEFITPLRKFIEANPETASVITSLVPVFLVAGLTIAICPILLVIANKAETINTRLGIHNSVLERFWKFLMVNGVVFFAIGQSAIQAYLSAFQNNNFDPLPVIASAFPTAAPYFASYVLLQTAIQPFFELFRFGLPAIVYVFGTRVSVTPRQRNGRTEYPTFSHFSQVPQQRTSIKTLLTLLTQVLAGAIMHLFMLLNPLVIPFCLVFYGSCYLVWKKQFSYVYGRLYENNGRRTSIRVLRYSLDALALGQFVLVAFFILSQQIPLVGTLETHNADKAKGHAIATGILCFLTMVAKLIITRALKTRFDNLDNQEADILCPPVVREEDEQRAVDPEESLESWTPVEAPSPKHERGASAASSRIATFKHDLATWAGRWGYAASHRSTPIGYRKPIPFDHVLFSTLDSKIAFDKEEPASRARSSTLVSSVEDTELQHEPDHAIQHELAAKLVVPHHNLRPWEDIPPYQRSRGYNDQPAYTNDYDDFLWLPRDPLSTLDLDDTVEMRLSLTTSVGGSGRIGDWPPVSEAEAKETAPDHEEDQWQEVYRHAADSREFERERELSPDATSDRVLLPLSPNIGSEVTEGFDAGLVRRRTKRVGEGLTTLFRRPRANTNRTDRSGAISMRTLSISSTAAASHMSHIGSSEAHAPLVSPASPSSPTTVGHDGMMTHRQPTIQLVTRSDDADDRQRIPTPYFPPLRSGTSASSLRTGARPDPVRMSSGEESLFLSPTRTSTPRQMAVRTDSARSGVADVSGIEELDLGTAAASDSVTDPHAMPHSPSSPTRTSRLTIQLGELGKSPSGRRPPPLGRLRSGTRTSASGNSDVRSLTRAGSIMSPSRTRSIVLGRDGRDRSTSVFSAQQEAWLKEVMEEERLASKDAKDEELAERARDAEELMKEAKRRRDSAAAASAGGLARSGSKMESGILGRSVSKMRAGSLRRGDSGVEMVGRSASRRVGEGSVSGAAAAGVAGAGPSRPLIGAREGSEASASSGASGSGSGPGATAPVISAQPSREEDSGSANRVPPAVGPVPSSAPL